jgi:electron transport complex protein RnfC
MPVGGFHGGLRLEGRKEAASRPIRRCPLPALLRIALRQHPGAPAQPALRAGARVSAGQRIACGDGPQSADLHAPCSGEVVGVESGAEGMITLRPDPRADAAKESALAALDPHTASPEQLRQRIAEAGIVGLGGGAFPSADKLLAARDTLLLNGAECEPLIACDNRLLQERAAAVIAGGELLRRACGAASLRIAIEDSMPAARAALEALKDSADFSLDVLPTRYPQGGERQLIESVLGIEVPRGGLPRDVGVAVFNVGTAEAVWQAVVKGRPLTHRLVSVGGGGVAEPMVLEAAIGTPLADLVAAAGGYREQAVRLILGGPLTGRALTDDSHGLRKGDNAVLVLSADELPARLPAQPCIRCGACAQACPSRLQPQLLWQFLGARQERRLLDHGLFDCIECAACDLVCPSHLPLAAGFRDAKQAQRLQSLQQEQARLARQRFEQRQLRLERIAAERVAQQAEQQRRLLAQDAVRAALQRARCGSKGDGA